MKKVFHLMSLAALALTMTFFVACGDDTKEDNNPPATDSSVHYALHYYSADNEAAEANETINQEMSLDAEHPTMRFYVENLTKSTLRTRLRVEQTQGNFDFQVCYAGLCREDQTAAFDLQPGLHADDPNSLIYIELDNPTAAQGDAIFKLTVGEGDGLTNSTTVFCHFVNDLGAE